MPLRYVVLSTTFGALYVVTACSGGTPTSNCTSPLDTNCQSCLASACGTSASNLASECTTVDSCLGGCGTPSTGASFASCAESCFSSALAAITSTEVDCLATNTVGSCKSSSFPTPGAGGTAEAGVAEATAEPCLARERSSLRRGIEEGATRLRNDSVRSTPTTLFSSPAPTPGRSGPTFPHVPIPPGPLHVL
jgi:hypothetical protein